jgi:5-methylcytosine-specific restriction endonuclease McrA
MNDYSHTKKPRKKRSILWAVSDKELREVVFNSDSVSNILRHFGINNKGGNYKTLYARLEHSNISTDHIPKGLGSNKGLKRAAPRGLPLEQYMVKNSTYNRGTLKKRLIKEGLIDNKCNLCGLQNKWQSKPIVLILDHINGISNDHRLENLRILCPNCNSQTDTFAGRNKKISNGG